MSAAASPETIDGRLEQLNSRFEAGDEELRRRIAPVVGSVAPQGIDDLTNADAPMAWGNGWEKFGKFNKY